MKTLEELLESLGSPEPELSQAELDAELDRLSREVDEGRAGLVSWEAVKAELDAILERG